MTITQPTRFTPTGWVWISCRISHLLLDSGESRSNNTSMPALGFHSSGWLLAASWLAFLAVFSAASGESEIGTEGREGRFRESSNQLASTEGLTAAPNRGAPSTPITLRGSLSPGPAEGSVYWEQGGILKRIGSLQPRADGTFEIQVRVPDSAQSGVGRFAILPVNNSRDRNLVSVEFEVVPPERASVQGVVRDASGNHVSGLRVRLRDARGQSIQEVATDMAGHYAFVGLLPGTYIVQTLGDGYPPEGVSVDAGASVNLVATPDESAFSTPPVFLLRAGAIAIPGGSYQGNAVTHVGEWTSHPFARLISLPGKGQPQVKVRFWTELQRGTLSTGAPLIVDFAIRTLSGQVVAHHQATNTQVVYPDVPHDFPAFIWDVNSLDLPPGKLQLRVYASTRIDLAANSKSGETRSLQPASDTVGPGTIVIPLGEWSFQLDVVGLGDRWFNAWTKDRTFKVTRKDFYNLLYEYQATAPNLPGIGTPILNYPIDLQFITVANEFNLGVEVRESMTSDGAWSGQAKANANLILFDQSLINESRSLAGPFGSSLPASTYVLQPSWEVPLPAGISIPVWGGGLPAPIEICGQKFGGELGVFFQVSGAVTLATQLDPSLKLTATMSPAITLALPAKASLELGVCSGHADVTPSATISTPIVVDPALNPPVAWNGLCFTLAASATASLDCCEIVEGSKSVELFDPIQVGSCASPFQAGWISRANPRISLPPNHGSIAVSPLGFAIAVWDHVAMVDGNPRRTAPVFSLFDGTRWTDPTPIAPDTYAGWDPQVAFVEPRRVLVTWIHPRASRSADAASSPAAKRASALVPHGFCSDIADALSGILCGALGAGADIVEAVGDILPFTLPGQPVLANVERGIRWQPPNLITDDDRFDLRPVLTGNPRTGEALLVWLREQDFLPGQQPLALAYSMYSNGTWTTPARLDPEATGMDLQPSPRFDRADRPAIAWIRDADADLTTTMDRRLLFARGGRTWSGPEVASPLVDSPWSPSLDFDTANRPVIAYVVPPFDAASGRRLPADGHLSELQLTRLADRGWLTNAVGNHVRAERPVLGISDANRATLVFRTFGGVMRRSGSSGIAAAVADLEETDPDWSVDVLRSQTPSNPTLAIGMSPGTGDVALFAAPDEDRQGGDVDVVRQYLPSAVDLAFGEEGVSFPDKYPEPGRETLLSVRLTNRGFHRFINQTVSIQFYDREPGREVRPFGEQEFRESLDFGESAEIVFSYTPTDRLPRRIYAVVDGANAIRESNETNNITTGVLGGVPPPQNFVATLLPSGNAVHLQWSAAVTNGGFKYWIWRKPADGPMALIGSTDGEEFTDDSVVPGLRYSYEIDTVEPRGDISSDLLTAALDVPPRDPTSDSDALHLSVASYGGGVHLFWNRVPAVQLEVAEDLNPGVASWTAVTNGMRELGGGVSYSEPSRSLARFFRLARR